MAELIITVSVDGQLVVRSEGLSRAQWEEATAELRAVLGEPTVKRSRQSTTFRSETPGKSVVAAPESQSITPTPGVWRALSWTRQSSRVSTRAQ